MLISGMPVAFIKRVRGQGLGAWDQGPGIRVPKLEECLMGCGNLSRKY